MHADEPEKIKKKKKRKKDLQSHINIIKIVYTITARCVS